MSSEARVPNVVCSTGRVERPFLFGRRPFLCRHPDPRLLNPGMGLAETRSLDAIRNRVVCESWTLTLGSVPPHPGLVFSFMSPLLVVYLGSTTSDGNRSRRRLRCGCVVLATRSHDFRLRRPFSTILGVGLALFLSAIEPRERDGSVCSEIGRLVGRRERLFDLYSRLARPRRLGRVISMTVRSLAESREKQWPKPGVG